MKSMKKVLVVILVIAMAASVLTVSAMAADFENCADDLNALGLFKGTGNGYDLDSAPTRIQAGIMLIRLLGQENAALGSGYEHPFTDVPAWADKYVGYLYGTGLTKGISDTLFGTDNPCDARMYTTFVLRALGYDDTKGDFEYSLAVNFGKSIGIVDYYITEGNFLRDNMVAISFLSLKAQPKNGSFPTLLDKLVSDGAVTAADARSLLERFASYNACISAIKDINTTGNKAIDSTTEYEFSLLGQVIQMKSTTSSKYILDGNNPMLSVVTNTTTPDGSEKEEVYYKDGYLYVNAEGEKLKAPADIDSLVWRTDVDLGDETPLYSIKKITKTASGGNTVYKIEYTQNYLSNVFGDDFIDDMLDNLGLEDAEMSIAFNNAYMEITINAAGGLVSQNVNIDMDMPITKNGITHTMKCKMTMLTKVMATGSSVVVTFPSDLHTYVTALAAANEFEAGSVFSLNGEHVFDFIRFGNQKADWAWKY